MSLYETRNTPGYKQSKLVQVCALIPEYHREYPEAHITVKHVDFTGNRILFDYKDEKHFTGLHGDIEMDLDAFIDLLDSLINKDESKEIEDVVAFDKDKWIRSTVQFIRDHHGMNKSDFASFLDHLVEWKLISKEYGFMFFNMNEWRFSK